MEDALQRIAENKKTKNPYLDLGNCGLTELPPELLDCDWLETLILSNERSEYDPEKRKWEKKKSQNEGEKNNIRFLPPDLPRLLLLKKLVAAGRYNEKWELSDLSPLKGLQNLQQLNFYSTQVSDLSPLKDLQNLQQLGISYTKVADLSPLKDLQNLQQLSVSFTQLADLSPLKGLQKLQQLNVHSTQVADLSPLKGLQNLQKLYVYSTQVADLSPLKELQKLQQLGVSYTQVADLSPLKDLQQLQQLDVSHTQVADLSPLKGLQKLQQLYVSSKQVADLSPLKGLQNLQKLYVYSTQVADLSPLKGLQKLQQLNVYSTQVADLSPLKGLQNLQQLGVSSTQVADLSPLKGLQNLQQLSVSSTQVADLSPLKGSQNLQQLDVSYTRVTDLSSLKGLQNLQQLNVSSTQVADLSPLKDLQNLQQLSVSYTQVSDLSPIVNLSSLIRFDATNCPIQDCPADVWQSGDPKQLRAFFVQKAKAEKPKQTPVAAPATESAVIDNRRDVKLILLGNSDTGKSNLAFFLEKGEFKGKRDSTHGLTVHRWLPDAKYFPSLKDVAVSIWDFGGQEYYHGAYRLFMSANAVYLFLWCRDTNCNGRRETRLNDNEPPIQLQHFEMRYWLDTVRHYGGASANTPLLVVQNKTDDLDAGKQRVSQELHEKYGIHDSFHISLREGCNTKNPRQQRLLNHFKDELEHLLAAEADRAENRPDWNTVRLEVLALREKGKKQHNAFAKHIGDDGSLSLTNFEKICVKLIGRNLSEDEAYTLPRWLDRGGSAVFFPDLGGLNDRIFLRPDLLAEKIYRVLNKRVLAQEGVFNPDEIFQEDKKFKSVFLGVAQKMELIFPHPDTKKRGWYIAPQYLPENHPIEDLFKIAAHGAWQSAFWLKIPLFYYKKLLHGLVLHYASNPSAQAGYFWKHGIVFLKNDLRVLIKGLYPAEDEHEGKLLIGVEKGLGEAHQQLQKDIFSVCWHLLSKKERDDNQSTEVMWQKGKTAEINVFVSYSNKALEVSEVMYDDELFDESAEALRYLEVSHNGEQYVRYIDLLRYARNGEAKIPAPDEKNMLLVRHFGPLLPFSPPRAKRVFLSYSHQNAKWLGRLRTHLAGLRRAKEIETWTDQEILPGEPWNAKIREQLEAADVFILLLSADFIASEYIWETELNKAFEKLNARKAIVIPVLAEPLDLGGLPGIKADEAGRTVKINDYEIVPKDESERLKAISLWTNSEEALAKVAERIRAAIRDKS